MEAYEGWLVPAQVAAGWEQLLPGASDRILSLTERQAAHRQGMEQAVILGNVRAQRWGMVFTALIGSIIVIGGMLLIWSGREISGLIAIAAQIGAVLTAYLKGRNDQRANLDEKAERAMSGRGTRR